MANELVGACWLIDFPSASMRFVMMKICDCADPDGTNIFPSVPTICEETNLASSTVRQALAAFEQCSLLSVKENKFGNRYGKTTVVRELDTDFLRLITGKRVKGKKKMPSTHVLALVDVVVEPGADTVLHLDAVAPSLIEKPADELRRMKVWAIVPRSAGLGEVDENEPSTPPANGGATTNRPSNQWKPPLRSMEGTPPANGANPFLDPSLDPSPQPPGVGGRVRAKKFNEVESALHELIAETSDNEAKRFALNEVVAPIVTQLRFEAPIIAGALRELVKWASEQSLTATEAPALVRKVLKDRHASVKPSDIQDAVRHAIARRPAPRKIAGDPRLMADWHKVMAHLEHMCGQDRAQQAFSTFAIDRIGPPNIAGRVIAHISTHEEWARKNVELGLTSQFRAALNAVFPGVTDIYVSTRRAVQ